MLSVLASSCEQATAAVQLDVLIANIVAIANGLGVTITATDVTAVIRDCSAARRLAANAVRGLQTAVVLDLSTQINNLDSGDATLVGNKLSRCFLAVMFVDLYSAVGWIWSFIAARVVRVDI